MDPTDEQRAVIESDARVLLVPAFAGSGKTTALRWHAAARSRERVLYLAYNKSVQMEAAKTFPSNTQVLTSHALAYRKVGYLYKKAGKLVGRIRPTELIDMMKHSPVVKAESPMMVAKVVLKTIDRFLASVDARPGARHLPAGPEMTKSMRLYGENIIQAAEQLWARMQDLNDRRFGMTHDGYLKLFQLQAPRLPYDRILFDEAQDANPVTTDIVLNQRAAKVLVGDTHQQIYTFRGAEDAMELMAGSADETACLTNSFRFGEQVAFLANLLLGSYKAETRAIVARGEETVIGPVGRKQPYALISRGNASLFIEAVERLRGNERFHFIGGIQKYPFDQIIDAHNLRYGGPVLDAVVKSFRNYGELSDEAKELQDPELMILVRIVEEYGNSIPRLVENIRKRAEPHAQDAHVYFTTTHKAKGLEFDQVKLADDFLPLTQDAYQRSGNRNCDLDEIHWRPSADVDAEAINLMYVATTRGRRRLDPSPDLKAIHSLGHDFPGRLLEADLKNRSLSQGRSAATAAVL